MLSIFSIEETPMLLSVVSHNCTSVSGLGAAQIFALNGLFLTQAKELERGPPTLETCLLQ